MRIRLAERWTKKLVNLPEDGMGYQRVDVRFASGKLLEDVYVFNAEEIDLPAQFAEDEIELVQAHRSRP